MSIIRNIILFFKNIFNKKEYIKALEAPKQIVNSDKKSNFIQSLKINSAEKTKEKKIETLICKGNGLGIQKKVNC